MLRKAGEPDTGGIPQSIRCNKGKARINARSRHPGESPKMQESEKSNWKRRVACDYLRTDIPTQFVQFDIKTL
jgi:hypothetical protein